MDPNAILAKGKAQLVAELNIGHFSPEEQDAFLEKMGEYLMRRVLTKMFDAVTDPADRKEVEKLIGDQNFLLVRAIVEKYIRDVDTLVQEEARAGLEEYKKELIKEAETKA